MKAFTVVRTCDGTVIACDPSTGITASALTVDEALAELRRLLAMKDAA
ncbi:hypothetical protein X735_01470 [Mesorhizobium sp. L2C085B000]|nr:hypothetical protein X735_01470 [Mesorhizobium sp. L2C085B000]